LSTIYFGIIVSYKEARDLIEFFGWIKCGLCPIDLISIFNLESIPSNHRELFKKNEIEFFYSLSLDQQNRLIDRYNRECVDKYNQYMREEYQIEIDTFEY
jgi:hypothetical protein